MPRKFEEPEYRRRIRQQAEDEKREAERERRHRENRNAIDGIVGEINATKAQAQAHKDDHDSKWKSERHAQYGEIAALVAAAVVGVIAIIVSSVDSANQRSVMEGQLTEAHNQRLAMQAQMRANLRWEQPSLHTVDENGKLRVPGETFSAWEVSPFWTNIGSTDALSVRGWFDIRAFDTTLGKKIGPGDCPDAAEPQPTPLAKIVAPGGTVILLAKKLSTKDAAETQTQPKYILMWGHIEYREIFPSTPLHHTDWCVVVVPNDLPRSLFSYPVLRDIAD